MRRKTVTESTQFRHLSFIALYVLRSDGCCGFGSNSKPTVNYTNGVKQQYLSTVEKSSFDCVHKGDVKIALLEACWQLQQQIEDAVIVSPDHVENAADHHIGASQPF